MSGFLTSLDPGNAVEKVQLYDLSAYPELSTYGQIRVRALASFYQHDPTFANHVGIQLAAYRGDPAAIPLDGGVGNHFIDPETYPEDNLLQRLITDVPLQTGAWQPVQTEWVLPEETTFFILLLEMRERADGNDVWVDYVSVVIDAGNAAPFVADDVWTTRVDGPVTGFPLSNDYDPDGEMDPATFTIVDPPQRGVITEIAPSNTGLIAATYTPNPGFSGTDTFTYTVADDDGDVSNPATIWVTITTDPAPVVLSDSTFHPADWAVERHSEYGASQTNRQEQAGGNPGAFRAMQHVLPSPPSPSDVGLIQVTHLYQGEQYIPSVQGAIGHVDYSEDTALLSLPNVAQPFVRSFAALSQDGKLFRSGAFLQVISSTAWTPGTLSGLTANDFVALDGSNARPDFSENGGAIHFGFFRTHSRVEDTPVPYNQHLVIDHGIDNFMVIIHPASSTHSARRLGR